MASALPLSPVSGALAAAERRVERDRAQVQEARQRLARSQEQLRRDEQARNALEQDAQASQAAEQRAAAEEARRALAPAVNLPSRADTSQRAAASSKLGQTIDTYA